MVSNAGKPSGGEPQDIGRLQERYQLLLKHKTQAETALEIARKDVQELKAQARAEWGTDDLAALKAKLEEIRAENLRKRAEYQASLDRIEADLREVEGRAGVGEGGAGRA
jgi:hypothetical protein